MNKVVRVTEKGIELEADPRHAELLVKELGLENAKTSAVPGSKEEAKRVSASISGTVWGGKGHDEGTPKPRERLGQYPECT